MLTTKDNLPVPKPPTSADRTDDELYAVLDELDRLEELIEDMESLAVFSREEAEQRLAELNARVEEIAPDARDQR